MSGEDTQLDALRRQLDTLDQELLEVARRRLDVVQSIGEVKARLGRPVFDREREQRVLSKTRDRARKQNVPEHVAEGLMQVLIEASHDLQEHTLEAAAPPDAACSRRVLIIGGGGVMGRRFVEAFGERGHVVEVLEAGQGGDHQAMVARADVTMIAVPMGVAADVAREVAPWVRPDALLCDINSLKESVCDAMSSCRGAVVGTHPMFGPTVHSLRRQKVVVCPVKEGPLVGWLCDEFQRLGMELIETSPAAHDRMMAVVQVLVHFNTLVMGSALRRCGVSVEESLRFTSPIYRLELAFVGRLFTQDPGLYAEIEMQNPYSAEVRAHYRAATSDLDDIINQSDRAAFSTLFQNLAGYFSDFAEDAMTLSDFVIDAIVAR